MIVSKSEVAEILSIRTFGELTVAMGGVDNSIRFETRTVEALLVYLAFQGRPLGRDSLAELLYPERTHEQARTNLRVTLYRLRRQIAPYLLITRQSIALNPNAPVVLDARQFEGWLATGHLVRATELYRGDFLDGFYLDASPAFEQWALLERERLRNLAIAAYQQLIDRSSAAGESGAAIAYAQHLLQLDPFHEPTYRQLMRLLTYSGQRSAALAQYEICRQLLKTQLGVNPDDVTTALHERILANELDSKLQPEAAAGSSSATELSILSSHQAAGEVPHAVGATAPALKLPLQPTAFIGRAAELAQIEQLLSNPDCRLLTLAGVGGIGKTRLALEVGQRILELVNMPESQNATQLIKSICGDGVYFVSLASVMTPELALLTIAQSLNLQITSNDPLAEIAAFLRPRRLLLILDNCEHLSEIGDSVANLLQNAATLKIVVTSRERLYLREEWLLPISGLSVGEGAGGEAAQLFLRSAQRVSPNNTTLGQEESIAAICRYVEGMPLALELAASWARVMSYTEIAHQIQGNFDFLATTLRNLPERHRSVRALFDQSWHLLSTIEQGVLMRLSVFAGGWVLEEAVPVAGATLDLLSGLVDKSLVRASRQNRFDLHELARQYVAEKLVINGDVDQVRQRHFAAYLHLMRVGDGYLRGPDAESWWARLEPEQDNLRAALQWALDEMRYEDAASLLLSTLWFWHLRGYWYEFGRWLARLLPYRNALHPNIRLAILLTLYSVARAVEEFQPLDRWVAEGMQLLDSCTYKLLYAGFWHFVAMHSSDLPQSSLAWERSIDVALTWSETQVYKGEFGIAGDRDFVMATSMRAYATRLTGHGELARAATLSMQSLKLFQARGSRYEPALSLYNLGFLALLQGDLAQAELHLREGIALAETFKYQEALAEIMPLLGVIALYQGDGVEALRLLTESLRVCTALKDRLLVARTYAHLAEAALTEGDLEQSAEWLEQSLANHAEWRIFPVFDVARLFVAGRLATAQQQYYRAATLFGLAEQAHSSIHHAIAGVIRSRADSAQAITRQSLGEEPFNEAFAAGQLLDLSEAYATFLPPDNLLHAN